MARARASGRVDRSRRLLHHFLVAALYGTVAVEKVQHLPATVPDDLDLQVATARAGNARRTARHLRRQPALPGRRWPGRPRVLAARSPPSFLCRPRRRRPLQAPGTRSRPPPDHTMATGSLPSTAGSTGAPASRATWRAWSFRLISSITLRLRPNERQAGRLAGGGKGGALGQEPVARVDGVGALLIGGPQDGLDGQVRLSGGRRPDPDRPVGLGDVRRVAGRRPSRRPQCAARAGGRLAGPGRRPRPGWLRATCREPTAALTS